MIIGVDIDGVLCKLNKYTWYYFKKYLKANNIPFKFNKTKETFCKQLNVSEEIENQFWEQANIHYTNHVKPINNASKIVKKNHDDGHKIIIITSRISSFLQNEKGEHIRDGIKKWLNKNKIYYDKIYFCRNKKNILLQEKVDVMIEDSKCNIEEFSKFIPVIIFKNPANKLCKGKNKILANSWKEIYKIILNMDKQKALQS